MVETVVGGFVKISDSIQPLGWSDEFYSVTDYIPWNCLSASLAPI